MTRVRLLAQPRTLVGESVRMDGDDVIWLDPPEPPALALVRRGWKSA